MKNTKEAIEHFEDVVRLARARHSGLSERRIFETALQALKEKEELEDNGLSAPDMAKRALQNCDEWCDGDPSVGVQPCRFFRESDTGESWCSLKKYLEQNKKNDGVNDHA